MIKKNGLWAVFSATLTPSLLISTDSKSWKVIATNTAFEKLVGLGTSKIVGSKLLDFIKGIVSEHSKIQKIDASLKSVCSTHTSQDFLELDINLPFDIPSKAHPRKWRIKLTPIVHFQHKLEAILLSILDVTDQIKSVEKLKAHHKQLSIQQQSYTNFFDHHPDLLFRLDAKGELVEANKAFHSFFSIPAGYISNIKLTNLVGESDRDILVRSIQKSIRGESVTVKIQFKLAKTRHAMLELKLIPVLAKGMLVGVTGTMVDRSLEMEQQHKILIKSIYSEALSKISQILMVEDDFKNQLEEVFDTLGNALMVDRVSFYKKEILTLSGQLITDRKIIWNKKRTSQENDTEYHRFFLDDHKLVKDTLFQDKIFKANAANLPKGELKAVLKEHQIASIAIVPLFFENKFYGLIALEDCTDGRTFALEDINFLKNLKTLISLAIEKNEIAKAKAASKLQNERLLQNIAGIAYRCLADESLTVTILNHEFYKITGFPPEDFLYNKSRSFKELIHPEDLDTFIETQINGPTYTHHKIRILNNDGKYKWMENRSIKIYGDHKKIEFIEGVMLDGNYA